MQKNRFAKKLKYGKLYCAEHDTLKRQVKPSIVYDVMGFDTGEVWVCNDCIVNDVMGFDTGEVWVCNDCLDIDMSARRIKA